MSIISLSTHSLTLKRASRSADSRGHYAKGSESTQWSGVGYIWQLSAREADYQRRRGVEADYGCVIAKSQLGSTVPTEDDVIVWDSVRYDVRGVEKREREASYHLNHYRLHLWRAKN